MREFYPTPPAPSVTPVTHRHIPKEICRRRAWCPFLFELRDSKRTKIPYNPRIGRRARSNDPKTWGTFEEASSKAAGYDGIEYMLSKDDPHFLIDLDECREPETGELTPEAQELIALFAGKAFIEASTSGKGVHVFGRGTKPGAEWCKNKNVAGMEALEVYDWGRPVVFTGFTLEGSTSELLDCQDELDDVYHRFMPEHLKSLSTEPVQTPCEPVDLPDDELLQRAANSKYGDEFRALWAGDVSVVGGDHSTADFKLMKSLMFWTRGDEARAIAMFSQSGLARRKKWNRADYRQRTARKARMACTSFYQPKGEASEKLEAAVEDLWRRWWEFDWTRLVGTGERPNSMRGHTSRDVLKVLIDEVASHGKVVEGGVEVSLGRRKLARKAATSQQTLHKAIKHLEAENWLEFKPPPSKEKPGTYFMRATLDHVLSTQGGGSKEENGEEKKRVLQGGDQGLRAPRLRWSSPGRGARRGVVRETSQVRDGGAPPREGVKRLGKIRGAVVDTLENAGGRLALVELAHALGKTRPRDLDRRKDPETGKGRDGPLIWLKDEGIVSIDDDVVSLITDWMDRLEEVRVRVGEVERERLDRERHEREGKAFRNRHKVKTDEAPTPEELEAGREAFEATLEANQRARELELRDKALEAFRALAVVSGARKNLELAGDGELTNVEYVVKSVLQYHGMHPVHWWRELERWRAPVLEAGAIVARELATSTEPDDWRKHDFACECIDCSAPGPRYARPCQPRRSA
jgi:putative DNA primase/helicase